MPKDTRTEIINTATELFCTQGYQKTSLRQIAKEVGIKEPSIFSHFKNKNVIAEELIKKYLIFLDNQCDKNFFGTQRDMTEHWKYFWCLHFKVMQDNPSFADFYMNFYKNAPIDFVKYLIKTRINIPLINDELKDPKLILITYSINVVIDMKMIELCMHKYINIEDAVYEMLKNSPRISEFKAPLKYKEDLQGIKEFYDKNFENKFDILTEIKSIMN